MLSRVRAKPSSVSTRSARSCSPWRRCVRRRHRRRHSRSVARSMTHRFRPGCRASAARRFPSGGRRSRTARTAGGSPRGARTGPCGSSSRQAGGSCGRSTSGVRRRSSSSVRTGRRSRWAAAVASGSSTQAPARRGSSPISIHTGRAAIPATPASSPSAPTARPSTSRMALTSSAGTCVTTGCASSRRGRSAVPSPAAPTMSPSARTGGGSPSAGGPESRCWTRGAGASWRRTRASRGCGGSRSAPTGAQSPLPNPLPGRRTPWPAQSGSSIRRASGRCGQWPG